MSPLAALIREEISRAGPITFERFMDLALYHPEHGYYRGGRERFGRAGDYYTAAQLQPVFGSLIAARIRRLFEELGRPTGFTVMELGAGRSEMAAPFSEFAYLGLEIDRGALPASFCGVVFANEFFDALPVRVVARRGGAVREMRVGWSGFRFCWVEGEPAEGEVADYARRYLPLAEEGDQAEVNLRALRWLEEVAGRLERGYLLIVDYGYTTQEAARFAGGTLMSYRRHAALEDVLEEPGERDITAHVCFTALQEHAAVCGLRVLRFETLAQTLMGAATEDVLAAALSAGAEPERLRRRLQLKTLLVGMGETFRTLLLGKNAPD